MKKAIGFFMAFIMLMSVAGIQIPVLAVSEPQIIGDEMIPCGDFESVAADTPLNGITDVTIQNADTDNSVVYEGNQYVHGGTKSAKIVQNGNSGNAEAGINFQNITIEAGNWYRISAWVCYDEAFTDAGVLSVVFAGGNHAADYFKQGAKTNEISGQTGMVYISADIQAFETETLRVKVSSNAQKGEVFYVDDVSCVQIEAPEQEEDDGELITDGGFEGYEPNASFPTSGDIRVNNGTGVIVNKNSGADGSKCLQITCAADAQGALNYIISLEAGVTYYFSADVCYENGYGGGVYARITDVDGDFAYADRALLTGLKGGADFVTLGAYYTPSKDFPSARLNIVIEQKGAVAYIDNVSCKKAEKIDPMVKTGNLIGDNASFEFIRGSIPTIGNGSGVITDKYSNRGKYSLQITHDVNKPDNELGVNFSGQTLTAGKTYRFGAWVRMDEATTAANPTFYVRMMDDSTSTPRQLVRVNSPVITKDCGFTFVSAVYTAETDVTNLRLNIGMSAKNGAVGYVDDVTFEEVDSVNDTNGNLITNGTFEESAGYLYPEMVYNLPYTFSAGATYATVADAYDRDYVYSGQYALKVEQTTSAGSVVFEKGGLEPGAIYTFGVWVRFDKSVTSGERIYINNYLGQGLTMTPVIKGSDGYVYLRQKLIVPKDTTTLKFQIKADTGDGSSGKKFTYYIDDVSLVKSSEICDIDSARLYKKDSDGKWITADYTDLSAGSRRFTVSGITNVLTKDAEIAAFIAVYDAQKRLVTVSAGQAAVAQGTTADDAVTLSVEADVPESLEGGVIKTFIWDADTLTPYEKPVKLLIIGNSITQHSVAAEKGWLHDWGMAATAREKDYAHLLTAKAAQTAPRLNMKLRNISEFETYFYDFSQFDISKYDEFVSFDADIIICTIGANIKNLVPEEGTGEVTEITFDKEYYKAIIDHFNPNGNAKVIVGTTIFTNEGGEIQTAIKEAADTYGYSYVKMNDLTDSYYTAWQFKDYFPENISGGVLNHPGDYGMAEMADRLWPELEAAMAQCGISK